MTKIGVCIASALRRLCVGQVVGPLGAVLLAATSAQAGAWEEFETRCLVPMENLAPFDMSGLQERSAFPVYTDLEGVELEMVPDAGERLFEISSTELFVGITKGRCAIYSGPVSDGWGDLQTRRDLENWKRDEIINGRYEAFTGCCIFGTPSNDGLPPQIVASTTWRELKMTVTSHFHGPASPNTFLFPVYSRHVLIAEETDLES